MIVSIFNDVLHGVIFYKPVINNPVAITCTSAACDFPDRAFVVQDCFDTFRGTVALCLVDREHDIDDHLAVSGGRVVVLIDGLPMAVVGLQNLFCDIIILDVAEPAVQFCYEDHIDLIAFYILQQEQKSAAVLHWLSRGNTFIRIASDNSVVVFLGKFCQGFFLRR